MSSLGLVLPSISSFAESPHGCRSRKELLTTQKLAGSREQKELTRVSDLQRVSQRSCSNHHRMSAQETSSALKVLSCQNCLLEQPTSPETKKLSKQDSSCNKVTHNEVMRRSKEGFCCERPPCCYRYKPIQDTSVVVEHVLGLTVRFVWYMCSS